MVKAQSSDGVAQRESPSNKRTKGRTLRLISISQVKGERTVLGRRKNYD